MILLNLTVVWGSVKLDISNHETSFQSSSNSLLSLDCQITLGDISINQEKDNFISIDISTSHHSMNIGNPELPQINKLIEIPQSGNPRFEITNEKYIIVNLNDYNIDNKIIPVQPPRAKSGKNAHQLFTLNQTIYNKNEFINDEIITIDEFRGCGLAWTLFYVTSS